VFRYLIFGKWARPTQPSWLKRYHEEKNSDLCGTYAIGAAVSSTLSELPATPSADKARLDRSLVGGIAWTGGTKWLAQIISWASTLVIVRLLTPEDYGLVGMASVYFGLVSMFNEFGLGSAVVTLHKLTGKQVAQINTLSVFLGMFCFVFSCVAAIPIALFYRAPQLQWVITVMSISFMIMAFQSIPHALLQRELRFKFLAVVEGCQTIVQSLAMVIFALLGFGYWTLVIGSLLGAIVSASLVCLWRSQGFARPCFQSLQDAVAFSRDILVSRLSWYTYSNADFLVAGRVLGKAALGAYTFAWTLACEPVKQISALISRVTPAVFSAVQTDYAALRRYLLSLTEVIALVTFPAAFGLVLVAEEFVLLAMGQKWLAVIAPLRLLAVYASFQSISTLLSQILRVTGESRFAMWNALLGAVLLPSAFYVGSHWGTVGIAVAWPLIHPLVTFPVYWRVFHKIDLSVRRYLQSLWPALSGSLFMVVAVWVIREILPSIWPLPLRFGLQVLGGSAAYILTLTALHRERLYAFHQVLKKVRG